MAATFVGSVAVTVAVFLAAILMAFCVRAA